MPLMRPNSLSLASRAAGPRASPSIDTGSPRSKPTSMIVALSGACSGETVRGEDVVGHFLGRVLQHLALRGHVQQVGVDREGRLAALVLGDGDLVLFGEVEQRGARGQVPFAPGRDHLDVGLERVVAELEAHLVVALAGRPVAHGVGPHGPGDLDLLLGDQRPGDRRAEEVESLVLRVGAEHREHVVPHELVAKVFDEDVLGLDAEQQGLLPRRLQLLALAEVGREGHDLAAVSGLQPLQDDGGVEPPGIGQDDAADLLRGLGHGAGSAGWGGSHTLARNGPGLARRGRSRKARGRPRTEKAGPAGPASCRRRRPEPVRSPCGSPYRPWCGDGHCLGRRCIRAP